VAVGVEQAVLVGVTLDDTAHVDGGVIAGVPLFDTVGVTEHDG
tara:strand:- start:111 stop:239 length:129 start_codon:yes stop_codon:yes gene_type:complete